MERQRSTEQGVDKKNGNVVVAVNPAFYRPTDVVNLCGNPQKAKEKLGWNPRKTSYDELIRRMVEHDMELVRQELRG